METMRDVALTASAIDMTAHDSRTMLRDLTIVLGRLEQILAGLTADGRAGPRAVERVESSPGNYLWGVEEVARFLHRSPRWVYGAIASPRMGLPFFRLPGRGGPRFDPAAVRKWLETQCNPHESRRRRGA
jgi:hypothetical protein